MTIWERYDELAAELATVKAERDEKQRLLQEKGEMLLDYMHREDALRLRLDAAEAELTRLRVYVQHKPDCRRVFVMFGQPNVDDDEPCTCGLSGEQKGDAK